MKKYNILVKAPLLEGLHFPYKVFNLANGEAFQNPLGLQYQTNPNSSQQLTCPEHYVYSFDKNICKINILAPEQIGPAAVLSRGKNATYSEFRIPNLIFTEYANNQYFKRISSGVLKYEWTINSFTGFARNIITNNENVLKIYDSDFDPNWSIQTVNFKLKITDFYSIQQIDTVQQGLDKFQIKVCKCIYFYEESTGLTFLEVDLPFQKGTQDFSFRFQVFDCPDGNKQGTFKLQDPSNPENFRITLYHKDDDAYNLDTYKINQNKVELNKNFFGYLKLNSDFYIVVSAKFMASKSQNNAVQWLSIVFKLRWSETISPGISQQSNDQTTVEQAITRRVQTIGVIQGFDLNIDASQANLINLGENFEKQNLQLLWSWTCPPEVTACPKAQQKLQIKYSDLQTQISPANFEFMKVYSFWVKVQAYKQQQNENVFYSMPSNLSYLFTQYRVTWIGPPKNVQVQFQNFYAMSKPISLKVLTEGKPWADQIIIEWLLFGTDADTQQSVNNLDTVKAFLNSNDQSQFILQRNSLSLAGTYRARLRFYSKFFNKVQVYENFSLFEVVAGPQGGSLSINPASGTELFTQFQLLSADWRSFDSIQLARAGQQQKIYYLYFYVDPITNNQIKLSSQTSLNKVSFDKFILPFGVSQIGVRVTDSLGGMTEKLISVDVKPDPSLSTIPKLQSNIGNLCNLVQNYTKLTQGDQEQFLSSLQLWSELLVQSPDVSQYGLESKQMISQILDTLIKTIPFNQILTDFEIFRISKVILTQASFLSLNPFPLGNLDLNSLIQHKTILSDIVNYKRTQVGDDSGNELKLQEVFVQNSILINKFGQTITTIGQQISDFTFSNLDRNSNINQTVSDISVVLRGSIGRYGRAIANPSQYREKDNIEADLFQSQQILDGIGLMPDTILVESQQIYFRHMNGIRLITGPQQIYDDQPPLAWNEYEIGHMNYISRDEKTKYTISVIQTDDSTTFSAPTAGSILTENLWFTMSLVHPKASKNQISKFQNAQEQLRKQDLAYRQYIIQQNRSINDDFGKNWTNQSMTLPSPDIYWTSLPFSGSFFESQMQISNQSFYFDYGFSQDIRLQQQNKFYENQRARITFNFKVNLTDQIKGFISQSGGDMQFRCARNFFSFFILQDCFTHIESVHNQGKNKLLLEAWNNKTQINQDYLLSEDFYNSVQQLDVTCACDLRDRSQGIEHFGSFFTLVQDPQFIGVINKLNNQTQFSTQTANFLDYFQIKDWSLIAVFVYLLFMLIFGCLYGRGSDSIDQAKLEKYQKQLYGDVLDEKIFKEQTGKEIKLSDGICLKSYLRFRRQEIFGEDLEKEELNIQEFQPNQDDQSKQPEINQKEIKISIQDSGSVRREGGQAEEKKIEKTRLGCCRKTSLFIIEIHPVGQILKRFDLQVQRCDRILVLFTRLLVCALLAYEGGRPIQYVDSGANLQIDEFQKLKNENQSFEDLLLFDPFSLFFQKEELEQSMQKFLIYQQTILASIRLAVTLLICIFVLQPLPQFIFGCFSLDTSKFHLKIMIYQLSKIKRKVTEYIFYDEQGYPLQMLEQLDQDQSGYGEVQNDDQIEGGEVIPNSKDVESKEESQNDDQFEVKILLIETLQISINPNMPLAILDKIDAIPIYYLKRFSKLLHMQSLKSKSHYNQALQIVLNAAQKQQDQMMLGEFFDEYDEEYDNQEDENMNFGNNQEGYQQDGNQAEHISTGSKKLNKLDKSGFTNQVQGQYENYSPDYHPSQERFISQRSQLKDQIQNGFQSQFLDNIQGQTQQNMNLRRNNHQRIYSNNQNHIEIPKNMKNQKQNILLRVNQRQMKNILSNQSQLDIQNRSQYQQRYEGGNRDRIFTLPWDRNRKITLPQTVAVEDTEEDNQSQKGFEPAILELENNNEKAYVKAKLKQFEEDRRSPKSPIPNFNAINEALGHIKKNSIAKTSHQEISSIDSASVAPSVFSAFTKKAQNKNMLIQNQFELVSKYKQDSSEESSQTKKRVTYDFDQTTPQKKFEATQDSKSVQPQFLMPADMINNDLAAEEDDYFQEDDAEVYDDSEDEDQEVHVKYLTWNKSFCRIWTPRFSLIVLNLLILVITAGIYVKTGKNLKNTPGSNLICLLIFLLSQLLSFGFFSIISSCLCLCCSSMCKCKVEDEEQLEDNIQKENVNTQEVMNPGNKVGGKIESKPDNFNCMKYIKYCCSCDLNRKQKKTAPCFFCCRRCSEIIMPRTRILIDDIDWIND